MSSPWQQATDTEPLQRGAGRSGSASERTGLERINDGTARVPWENRGHGRRHLRHCGAKNRPYAGLR